MSKINKTGTGQGWVVWVGKRVRWRCRKEYKAPISARARECGTLVELRRTLGSSARRPARGFPLRWSPRRPEWDAAAMPLINPLCAFACSGGPGSRLFEHRFAGARTCVGGGRSLHSVCPSGRGLQVRYAGPALTGQRKRHARPLYVRPKRGDAIVLVHAFFIPTKKRVNFCTGERNYSRSR